MALTLTTEPPAWYCAGAAPKLVTHLPLVTWPDIAPPPEGEVQSAAVGELVLGVPLTNCIHQVGAATFGTAGVVPVIWLVHLFCSMQNHIAPALVMMLLAFCSDFRLPWLSCTMIVTSSFSRASLIESVSCASLTGALPALRKYPAKPAESSAIPITDDRSRRRNSKVIRPVANLLDIKDIALY
jgi:hypothetical protein